MNVMRVATVPANDSVANLINGSSFEYPQQPSQVSAGLVADDAGVLVTVYAGARLVMEESPVFVSTETYPVVPDEMYLNFAVLPGERLVFAARDTSGADRTVGINVELTPVGR